MNKTAMLPDLKSNKSREESHWHLPSFQVWPGKTLLAELLASLPCIVE